jgi:hypothetical protein
MSGVELFALPAVLGGSTVTLGAAMTAAGTVFSAASMLQQGAAAKASSRYNAALYERNSQIAQQNAAFQEDRQRRLATQRMGTNRAAIGASGVTMDGSALDILESNAAQEELDALMIRWNGANVSGDLMSNAGLQRAQGTNAQIGSYIGAGSSILLGGAKTADRLKEPSGVKLTAGQTNPGREL